MGTAGLPGSAAFLAAGRLVLETFLRIEFLFTGGEHELSAAVTAHKRFVLVHFGDPPLPFKLVHLADLVFDPTLAGWRVCSSLQRPTRPLSPSCGGRAYF